MKLQRTLLNMGFLLRFAMLLASTSACVREPYPVGIRFATEVCKGITVTDGMGRTGETFDCHDKPFKTPW